MAQWPIWAIVVACGIVAQVTKLVAYSLTNRHFALAVLAQSHGLPSLPTAVLACLFSLTAARLGVHSAEAGFGLVFMVIVVHDTVKLRSAASQQREVLYRLVDSLPDAGPYHRRVSGYLDPRTHHPVHVVLGWLFGTLFGLAFGVRAG